MSNYGPWSVKGIDQRARDAAREAAREEGLTIGEYINRMLLEETGEESPSMRDFRTPRYPRAVEDPAPQESPRGGAFDKLIARLEAVEARSTLALAGIDQSLVGLVSRLNKTDAKSDQVAEDVESFIDDLRTTHEQLRDKVRALEEDDTGARNLDSLRSLEQALGELAGHVQQEGERQKQETQTLRNHVHDAGQRMSGIEQRVDGKLADASRKLQETLKQAEASAGQSAEEVQERVAGLESNVASKLSKLDQFNDRIGAVEGDVAGALTSIEAVMTRMQERLHKAEATTNSALAGLEQTFARLDERIDDIAKHASPEAAAELREQFESRFEGLASELRSSIETAREDLAREIEQSAQSPEQLQALENSVDGLQKRMSASEERNSRALEGMTNQVGRISSSFDRRLRDVESRDPGEAVESVRGDMEKLTQTVSERFEEFNAQNDEVINKITDQMASLADKFDARVEESEQRSANAIEQVGEQVANVAQRLQARQERAFSELKTSMETARKQQSVRLSDALSGVSDRIEKMQQQQASAMSPVQKAIASLATRLEALEDFNAPPHAEPDEHDSPDFAPPAFDHFGDAMEDASNLSFDEAEEVEDEPVGYPPASDLPEAAAAAPVAEAFSPEADDEDDDSIFEIEIDDTVLGDEEPADDAAEFEAGLPDLSDLEDTVPGDGANDDEPLFAEDDDEIHADEDLLEADSAEDDPLAELSGWDDGADEARDSDIFGEDDDVIVAADDPDDIDDTEAASDETASEDDTETPALEEDAEAMDYLSRARKAAMAATADPRARQAYLDSKKPRSRSRLPLVAAVSVVALATAAAGTFVTLRGLQDDPGAPVIQPEAPTQAEATSGALPDEVMAEADIAETPVEATIPEIEPLLPSELAGLTEADEAAVEEELFDAPETLAPAVAEPAGPSVNYAELPAIPSVPTLESAASTGNPAAQLILGEQRLEEGDYTSGPSLIRKAAEGGEPAAQYRLAKLHERGLGVPKDLAAARTWTERAAEGGNVKAMHDLAVYYAEGEGGQQSYAAAVEWFRKAAEYGLTDSQYNLAVLYEAGLGISPSQTEALYWYEVAYNQGDQGALDKVEELRSKVSLDDAQQAQRRAATWTASDAEPRANGQFGEQAWQGPSTQQVSAVQTVLGALGYNAGPADGIMGSGTREAINAYQREAGLAITGSITPELVRSLNETVEVMAQGG